MKAIQCYDGDGAKAGIPVTFDYVTSRRKVAGKDEGGEWHSRLHEALQDVREWLELWRHKKSYINVQVDRLGLQVRSRRQRMLDGAEELCDRRYEIKLGDDPKGLVTTIAVLIVRVHY